MGRKKSSVTRNKSISRHPQATRSTPSTFNLQGASSLCGRASIKQKPTVMDTESSSDSLPPVQNLHTALPIGREDRERRPKNRRKRRSSGDDVVVSRRDDSSDEEQEEEEQEKQEEIITISAAELEKWQQGVIAHVEDHFTNEQLKRIAEFGRVHGTIMQEARQYVGNMEMQLKHQFEEERASLRAQAEDFVGKAAAENEALRQRVGDLEKQVEGLEKQVDKLEVEVDALKMEKAQHSQQLVEERQGNREQTQQTHSPPNNQTQVQPGNGETNGNVENQSANGHEAANGYERGSLHPPLAAKQIPGGFSGVSMPTDPVPHHDVGLGKIQTQQKHQQSCSSAPARCTGIQSNPNQDGLLTAKSSEPSTGARKLRAPGETG